MSDDVQEDLGLKVPHMPANPLEAAKEPIPDYNPRTRRLPVGSVHGEGARPLPGAIEIFEDLSIPLRDGVTLAGDVYRPAGSEATPVVLIYTPYSKRGGFWNTKLAATAFGIPPGDVSGLQAFEALDPAYWTEHGYSIAVVDARGTGHSEGDLRFMGAASGRDVYDTVEWIAAQPWSTGKVAMAGNSQLAMVQWAAAAEQPPHLSAIAPWEGLTDVFRDVLNRGGIPDGAFHNDDIMGNTHGKGQFEDVVAMLERYPFDNAYWADKRADLSKVDIPAYVVASYSNPIHARNTPKAFQALASESKWLRIHNTMEWFDIASPERVDDLRRFFDRYLKEEDNGWDSTPRVRYSVLDPGGVDIVDRVADSWPPAPLSATTLYLDALKGTLSFEKPAEESSVSYDSTDRDASAVFRFNIEEETQILGPVNVRFWVETSKGSDLDLFASVYKVGPDGKPLYHSPFPGLKELLPAMDDDGGLSTTIAYAGPLGRLRVSHRALDLEKSTDLEPFLSHAAGQPVEPGEPVEVDVGLWPTGLLAHPGETLILEIAGYFAGPLGPGATGITGGTLEPLPTRNEGRHTIRTGGRYKSALFLPITK